MNLQKLEISFFHGWNGRHVWLITVVKLIFYDVIVMKETQILFIEFLDLEKSY